MLHGKRKKKKKGNEIIRHLTLIRLAAMLEQGETTALRQRSCTTKLHTATERERERERERETTLERG